MREYIEGERNAGAGESPERAQDGKHLEGPRWTVRGHRPRLITLGWTGLELAARGR